MMKAFALAGLLLAAAHYACAQIRLPFRCNGCERDEHGKIKRSRKAVNESRKVTPAQPQRTTFYSSGYVPLPVWEFHQDGTIKRLGQPFEALSHIGGGKLKRCDLSKVLTSNPPKTECSIGTYNTKGEWIHERTVYE